MYCPWMTLPCSTPSINFEMLQYRNDLNDAESKAFILSENMDGT